MEAMNDDINTPVLIAHLFDGVKWINSIADGREHLDEAGLVRLKGIYHAFVHGVLGLSAEDTESGTGLTETLINAILELRTEAKSNKDYALADRLRDELIRLGITIKDSKDGVTWEI